MLNFGNTCFTLSLQCIGFISWYSVGLGKGCFAELVEYIIECILYIVLNDKILYFPSCTVTNILHKMHIYSNIKIYVH
jgi:hypothetical protein